MKIVRTILEFNNARNSLSDSIGFVPTMGALHDGHLSLIKESKNNCNYTVVSIFVNPNQFGPDEDFDNYPRTLESDIQKLETLNIDILFLPESNELYPPNHKDSKFQSNLFNILEGTTRPLFFKGVCKVVARLFDIVKPTDAFFGEKDFQQFRIISDMATALKYNINIIPCKTIRESNGLAMSSRNEYLTNNQRDRAGIIFTTLQSGIELINSGQNNKSTIYNKLTNMILSEPIIKIDYLKIVDYNSLKEFNDIIDKKFVICIAVYIDNTRLIDNLYQ